MKLILTIKSILKSLRGKDRRQIRYRITNLKDGFYAVEKNTGYGWQKINDDNVKPYSFTSLTEARIYINSVRQIPIEKDYKCEYIPVDYLDSNQLLEDWLSKRLEDRWELVIIRDTGHYQQAIFKKI